MKLQYPRAGKVKVRFTFGHPETAVELKITAIVMDMSRLSTRYQLEVCRNKAISLGTENNAPQRWPSHIPAAPTPIRKS